MLVSEFDYNLPTELIAQQPAEPRDHSRLLAINRRSGAISDRFFYNLPEYLKPGDLLVFNDTRVIPARLFARKEGPEGAKVEVFLLKPTPDHQWECLVRPGKRARPGTKLWFPDGSLAEVTGVSEGGARLVQFPQNVADFRNWLARYGETPLPPYIQTKLKDPERYQTVYARNEGSVAAPTAGLHFTPELLEKIRDAGIETGFVTLDIGLGTFRPVQVETIEEHVMHTEAFSITPEVVEKIRQTKQRGGRVIAVGTTVVRVLESQADDSGNIQPGSGETAIFIYPGYRFKVLDALITNFHLPHSTLLMLVSAFAGRDLIMKSYEHAVAEKYHFFSFGDAMLIE